MNLPPQALVLDAGNTRTKAGWFVDGQLQEVWAFETEGWKAALQHWSQDPAHRPEVIAWMNVGHLPDLAAAGAADIWPDAPRLFPITALTPVPVGNAYRTPATLGPDRLAGIVAGVKKFPREKILVIDAGSAITYDYADASGTYLGGAISPGLQMRYQALHTFTAKLPLIGHQQEIPDLLGQSTEDCIRSGVVQGFLSEVKGMIAAFTHRFGTDMQVLVTGGDAYLLQNGLKTITFADQNLILKGIFEILIFNPQI